MKYRGLELDPSKLDEQVTVKPRIMTESAEAFKEATTQNGTKYLLPRIEAIHAGTTRNYTRYPSDKLKGDPILKSGVYSWLHPYAKPVIYNHDVNTSASGRIQAATFSEMTSAGRPGIIVVPKITEASAIEGILGGRLLTVSIGATTDSAICSICGTDIINEGFCGHMKGESFDGTTAEWIVGNVYFDELSWVNVPADQNAMVVSQGDISTAEAFGDNGTEIINLGKSTTEWLVDTNTAVAEGLTIKTEEGDTTLTEEQIKALQAELEAAKTAKEAAEQALATAVAEKEAAEAALETTKEALATKETELVTAQGEVTAKEEEVTELTSAKESLEAEKVALTASLAEEKTAREEAITENANLATEVHKATAERVVDLRISLGKESNREEAIAKFVGRSTESLNDSLADLLNEQSITPKVVTRQVEPVINPASSNTEEQTKTKTADTLTEQDVLMNLFRGPAFIKK